MIFAVNIPTNVLLRSFVNQLVAHILKIAHLDNIVVELIQEPVSYLNATMETNVLLDLIVSLEIVVLENVHNLGALSPYQLTLFLLILSLSIL